MTVLNNKPVEDLTLNEKQALFAYHIAQLIVWGHKHGCVVMGAEWFRTKEQAEIYAAQGKGIKKSNHRLKLALDLFAVVDGTVSWDMAVYEKLGKKWKTMHPLARWGGDFAGRDGVHFSFYHNGVS